jgi:hypothetical protein
MMPSPEVQLMVVAVFLYLQDTALLLHVNEGVLTCNRSGQWSMRLGSNHWHILGKCLYFPHPFGPQAPIYRMAWNFEGNARTFSSAWEPKLSSFKTLGRMTLLIGLLLYVALPIVIFFYLTDLAVLIIVIALYSSICVALLHVGKRQVVFKLTRKKLASLCFECLICPPLAVNLVRRITLDFCKLADLTAVAKNCLVNDSWLLARAQLVDRLDDEISIEIEGTDRFNSMCVRKEDLLKSEAIP